MRDLASRLRSIVQQDRSRESQNARAIRELTYVPDGDAMEPPVFRPADLEALASAWGGTSHRARSSGFVSVDYTWDGTDFHGKRRLCSYTIPADAPVRLFDPRIQTDESWTSRIVFFDIETTGLSGGAGTVARLVKEGRLATYVIVTRGEKGSADRAMTPERLARIREEPELVHTTVEEILRCLSPVQTMVRTVTQDTEFGGQQLKKGEKVVIFFGSANRDEEVFEDPEEFRIDREHNPHMAFGTGPHRCLGSNLGRREVKVALEEFLRRIPDFSLKEGTDPVWHGVGPLHLTFAR